MSLYDDYKNMYNELKKEGLINYCNNIPYEYIFHSGIFSYVFVAIFLFYIVNYYDTVSIVAKFRTAFAIPYKVEKSFCSCTSDDVAIYSMGHLVY